MGAILVGGVPRSVKKRTKAQSAAGAGLLSKGAMLGGRRAGGSAHLGRLPCGCTEHMLTLFQTNMGKLYVQADTHNTTSMYS